MNTLISFQRRRIVSLTPILLQTTRNPNPRLQSPRLFSHQSSWLSVPGKPLIKWPSPTPKPHHNPNPNATSNFTPTHFTTVCNLLTNPSISPGPALETALDQAGIELSPSLLLEFFTHFDSSPKLLFSLYRWAEKQPGYEFSLDVFNSMVSVLGKAREFDLAWSLILERSNADGNKPNLDSFAVLIRRYARAGLLPPAIRTFEYAANLESVHDSNLEMILFEMLVDSFCKEGHVRQASEYFDRKMELHRSWVPSTRVYNILLNGWFRSRKLKQAERLWLEMKKANIKPTIVTYGTLVEGYCRMRRVEMAIELVTEMGREPIEPNAIVYNSIIDALGEAGRFKEALGMMERLAVLESGPTISTYNSLVKGFCKAGDLVGASKILKMMISKGCVPTPSTYNYFFRYFSRTGKFEEGLNLYTKMIGSGYVPDRLTYHLLIKMLCEGERLDLAVQLTKEMRTRGWDLDLASCTMLIHLMCKMHRFEEAFGEFNDMIRRGIVPQYLTYQRMCDELKKQGMTEMARKLSDMIASVPHSTKLPNTYTRDVGLSHGRKTSIIRKAEAMSNILKNAKRPRGFMRQRSSPKDDGLPLVNRGSSAEDDVSQATHLIDEISRRVDQQL